MKILALRHFRLLASADGIIDGRIAEIRSFGHEVYIDLQIENGQKVSAIQRHAARKGKLRTSSVFSAV